MVLYIPEYCKGSNNPIIFDWSCKLFCGNQYLYILVVTKLTVWGLQTNITNILSDRGAISLYISNKVFLVDNVSTIKIWNLNDLRLFKEFKNISIKRKLKLWPTSIEADSSFK